MSKRLHALALSLALPSLALAATHAEKIDALIQSYGRQRQFNGSALVAEKGNVILKKGYGMANMEWQNLNTPCTATATRPSRITGSRLS